MKEITKIRDAILDKIKDVCGEITPDKKLVFILVVIVAFAAVNLCLTFRSIYKLGKKKAESGLIKIERLKTPEPEHFRFGPQSGKVFERRDNIN